MERRTVNRIKLGCLAIGLLSLSARCMAPQLGRSTSSVSGLVDGGQNQAAFEAGMDNSSTVGHDASLHELQIEQGATEAIAALKTLNMRFNDIEDLSKALDTFIAKSLSNKTFVQAEDLNNPCSSALECMRAALKNRDIEMKRLADELDANKMTAYQYAQQLKNINSSYQPVIIAAAQKLGISDEDMKLYAPEIYLQLPSTIAKVRQEAEAQKIEMPVFAMRLGEIKKSSSVVSLNLMDAIEPIVESNSTLYDCKGGIDMPAEQQQRCANNGN